jgi:IclR family pca regulon transcriptional regulator
MGRVLLGNMSDKELDAYFKHAELISYTPHTIIDVKKLHKIIKQTRIDGYSIVNQELEENLCSVAVPICNQQGKVLCAINVGMPVGQLKIEEIKTEYLPVLQEAASRAEAILAHH